MTDYKKLSIEYARLAGCELLSDEQATRMAALLALACADARFAILVACIDEQLFSAAEAPEPEATRAHAINQAAIVREFVLAPHDTLAGTGATEATEATEAMERRWMQDLLHDLQVTALGTKRPHDGHRQAAVATLNKLLVALPTDSNGGDGDVQIAAAARTVVETTPQIDEGKGLYDYLVALYRRRIPSTARDWVKKHRWVKALGVLSTLVTGAVMGSCIDFSGLLGARDDALNNRYAQSSGVLTQKAEGAAEAIQVVADALTADEALFQAQMVAEKAQFKAEDRQFEAEDRQFEAEAQNQPDKALVYRQEALEARDEALIYQRRATAQAEARLMSAVH